MASCADRADNGRNGRGPGATANERVGPAEVGTHLSKYDRPSGRQGMVHRQSVERPRPGLHARIRCRQATSRPAPRRWCRHAPRHVSAPQPGLAKERTRRFPHRSTWRRRSGPGPRPRSRSHSRPRNAARCCQTSHSPPPCRSSRRLIDAALRPKVRSAPIPWGQSSRANTVGPVQSSASAVAISPGNKASASSEIRPVLSSGPAPLAVCEHLRRKRCVPH